MFAGTERFQLRQFLGRGGMGAVYRVYDAELGQDVALKTLHQLGPDELYRLKSEFRSLAGMTHPNLVALHELVVGREDCFFTMEFVDGMGFDEYVRAGDPGLDLARLCEALRQLVNGLSALHAAGTVHRDIKPSNVLVERGGRVVLLDFGLAAPWVPGERRDSLGALVGTPAYMAPEQQWGGRPNPASDWYGVGVLLYETTTGRLPFEGPAGQILAAKARSAPPRPSALGAHVPEALDALITALLDPEPARRPSPGQVLATLDAALALPSAGRSLAPAARDAFVGRDAELAALRSSFESVRSGHPVVVHVHGPSGIGKTELVRRFLGSLERDQRAAVLRGRCHPRESVPYRAFDGVVDELSRWLLNLPEAQIARLLPRHADALLRLFAVLGRVPLLAAGLDATESAEPHEVRRRGFGALRELLARLADRERLVLWIDDLQWSDVDSAALLRALLEPPDPPAVLVLLSYRTEDRERIPSLHALDEGEPQELSVREIPVGPLAPAETRELARQLCPPLLGSDERISAISLESAGSPFFVGELVRSLASGAREDLEGRAPALRLADVVNERVRQLAPPASHVLAVVCTAGHILARSVALAAAGIGEAGRPVVFALEEQRFVRSVNLNDQPALEVYHDRIREAIVGALPADRLAGLHGRIAEALRAVPDPDPELLFEHFLAAGDGGLAGAYAVQAADRAARALAFDRAATLYREAVRLTPPGPTSWTLLSRLAEALGNCGRGREAAESFEAAADALAADGPDRGAVLSLRRRAAEHYLRSGHLGRGLALTRAVLAAVGVPLRASTRSALAEALYQRARLAWRGLGFELRSAQSPPAEVLLRLDATWGAAISLSVVNSNLSEPLAVRHLIEALNLGEPSRIIHALGYEAARGATVGGRFLRRRSQRIIRTVEELAAGAEGAYDRAWVHLSLGTTAYAGGRWREAQRHCDDAVAIWRAECTGVSWEIAIGEIFAVTALAHQGEMRALGERLPSMLADARNRGDLYATTGMRIGALNMLWLAQGQPGYAREQADDAIAAWRMKMFHVQHYLHLLAAVQIDLYLDDGPAAWRRIVATWPKVRKAQFLRMEMFRVEGYHLRARAALAAAARLGASRGAPGRDRRSTARLVRLASADARRIARNDLPSAAPFAAAIRAGVAHLRGRDADAVAEFRRAAAGFGRAGMALYRAAAEHRAGVLAGGADGRILVTESETLLRAQDVREPPALIAMLTPG